MIITDFQTLFSDHTNNMTEKNNYQTEIHLPRF